MTVGAVGEVSLHHQGHEEVIDVALKGMVDEFVFGERGGMSMWVNSWGRLWSGGWWCIWGGWLLLLGLQMFSIDLVCRWWWW